MSVLTFSAASFADEEAFGSLNLEKKQVETMVDTMVKSGRFSADEGRRAKREIASVQEEDIEGMQAENVARLNSVNYANHK